jgi:hypothetical protein
MSGTYPETGTLMVVISSVPKLRDESVYMLP